MLFLLLLLTNFLAREGDEIARVNVVEELLFRLHSDLVCWRANVEKASRTVLLSPSKTSKKIYMSKRG